MLQPLLRRTWAPKGKTPILYENISHQHLSVISAITLSPAKGKLNLYWSIQQTNIIAKDVIFFLRELRKSIPSKLTLILDRWSVHRAKMLQKYLEKHSRKIRVEWLPRYAPELNPTEQVWGNCKYNKLANLAPFDLAELNYSVRKSLTRIKTQRHLLNAFFKKAGLVL